MPSVRAIFLDRDGVLTRERSDYVKNQDELDLLPGIFKPLREIRNRGFRIILVTNQSVVGRGLASHETLRMIHQKLSDELEKNGCYLDAIYYCPHLPQDGCDCRKPQPGMILRAARELGIDLNRSWLIGDKEIDMEAARRAGCKGLKVPTNGVGLSDAVGKIVSQEPETTFGEA